MARAPGLAAPTLSPFGGSGAGFGAFSVVDPGREAYLIFLKVENSWENGKTSDADYLAAMRTYANALPEGSSTRLNTEQRILETTYRVERNVLVSQIDNGDKSLADLLAYDERHLQGLEQDSETYRDRVDLYRRTQQQMFSEAEDTIVQRYQEGTLTTAQLQAWYREQGGEYSDNPDLAEAIADRVHELDLRVLDERDSKMIQDYNDGKITDDEFLVYSRAARARYATGTAQAREWDDRIEKASDARAENGLLYRYGLSQRYAELQEFIKSNAGGSSRTSTSTSTRIILGSDGQWHTVRTSTTKAVKPSATQVAAHAKLRIQIADAKKQMEEIRKKLGAAPGPGGWVSTGQMISYYQNQQRDLARGSGDWYALQEKIDSLQERKHAEAVLKKQGIRITYPGGVGGSSSGGGSSGSSGGGGSSSVRSSSSGSRSGGGGGGGSNTATRGTTSDDVSIDQFMAALARVESGGRYDARNKSSGAFGKYQIMPANWPSWAAKYLGDANAKQTPENQEKVARGRITDFYNNLGSWDAVAYAWLNGPGKVPRSQWTSASVRYVSNVMGGLGRSVMTSPKGSTTTPKTSGGGGSRDTDTTKRGNVGGLSQVIAVRTTRRTGEEVVITKATNFPTNLDGRAFEKFYAAYERAFNSGAESFVDTSSGRAIAYFIGNDPQERIERMRDLDDLRVGYYKERAKAYEGTATEIVAANQYNSAILDMAAHEYRILDTANAPSRSSAAGGGNVQTNPLAGGNRLLDKSVDAINNAIAMAKAAFARGDVAAAYAHLQMAAHYLDTSAEGSGPLARLQAFLASSEQKIAKLQQQFGGVSPSEALGSEGGASFMADLERLRNADVELGEALSSGDDLLDEIKGVVKVDERGNVVLDSNGEVQLGDGWARFISPSGTVKIERLDVTGVDPKTGELMRVPDGFVKVVTKSGSSVTDAYAKWTVGNVGWIRGADGVNRALQGKVVTVVSNGKETTLFEDPLNPGHWSSSPVVFNPPNGFKAISGPGGTTIYQFNAPGGKGGPADGMTYSLQFDPKTGTYVVVGSRPGSLFQSEIIDQPVGGAGDANVLDLLQQAGFTRDNSGNSGFVDVATPVFGLTPSEYSTYLNPSPMSALLNKPVLPLNSSGSPDERDEAFRRARDQLTRQNDLTKIGFGLYAGKTIPGAGGMGGGGDRGDRPLSTGPTPPASPDPNARTALPPVRNTSGSPDDRGGSLPLVKLPTIAPRQSNADIDVAKRQASLNRLTSSQPASSVKASAPRSTKPKATPAPVKRRRAKSKVTLKDPAPITRNVTSTKASTLLSKLY